MKCKLCGSEVEELRTISVGGRTRRACEECAERLAETAEIQDAATGAMREMMGYRGR